MVHLADEETQHWLDYVLGKVADQDGLGLRHALQQPAPSVLEGTVISHPSWTGLHRVSTRQMTPYHLEVFHSESQAHGQHEEAQGVGKHVRLEPC